MFKKILIANRGETALSEGGSAKPHCMACAARAGDLAPIEVLHV